MGSGSARGTAQHPRRRRHRLPTCSPRLGPAPFTGHQGRSVRRLRLLSGTVTFLGGSAPGRGRRDRVAPGRRCLLSGQQRRLLLRAQEAGLGLQRGDPERLLGLRLCVVRGQGQPGRQAGPLLSLAATPPHLPAPQPPCSPGRRPPPGRGGPRPEARGLLCSLPPLALFGGAQPSWHWALPGPRGQPPPPPHRGPVLASGSGPPAWPGGAPGLAPGRRERTPARSPGTAALAPTPASLEVSSANDPAVRPCPHWVPRPAPPRPALTRREGQVSRGTFLGSASWRRPPFRACTLARELSISA